MLIYTNKIKQTHPIQQEKLSSTEKLWFAKSTKLWAKSFPNAKVSKPEGNRTRNLKKFRMAKTRLNKSSHFDSSLRPLSNFQHLEHPLKTPIRPNFLSMLKMSPNASCRGTSLDWSCDQKSSFAKLREDSHVPSFDWIEIQTTRLPSSPVESPVQWSGWSDFERSMLEESWEAGHVPRYSPTLEGSTNWNFIQNVGKKHGKNIVFRVYSSKKDLNGFNKSEQFITVDIEYRDWIWRLQSKLLTGRHNMLGKCWCQQPGTKPVFT